MNYLLLFLLIMFVSAYINSSLIFYLIKQKKKLKYFLFILNEVESGNSHAKVFIHSKGLISEIGYKINSIIDNYEKQIVQFKEYKQSNKQLFTSLSHDVRTPLTSLLGYLDAINDGAVGMDEKEEYIRIARKKSYQLKSFVDTLFEWAKLDSKEKKFNFKKIDINECTRNIIIDWLPIFEQKKIKLNIKISENETFIKLDKDSYIRIINNLIQNAVSHSEGDFIEIKIRCYDHKVIIKISNNGKGIPEKNLPYIFNRLYKCDDARSYKGSGLGLAITKELVTAHQGNISVTSKPNENTVFTIIFPIKD